MDGGILLEVAEVETVPVGLALFEADEERFVGRGHEGADVLYEPGAGLLELFVGEGDVGHSLELVGQGVVLVDEVRGEGFVEGAVAAEEAEQEAFPCGVEGILHVSDVEEVPGMLAGKGCGDLAAVEECHRDDVRLAVQTELLLGLLAQRDGGLDVTADDAALDQVDFDLDLLPLVFAEELAGGQLGDDVHATEGAFRLAGDVRQVGVDMFKTLLPALKGEVGEVYVDRISGQVPDEEVDGRSAVDGEDLLVHHDGKELQEDFHFLCIFSIHSRQVLWG